jgi:hypothetical protein
MPARGVTTGLVLAAAVLALPACSLAPKSFIDSGDPAPLVRARAMGLGSGEPTTVVVPQLIARLDDPDAVVRLSAIEELKRRTGQDFGYRPWEDAPERARAVAAWRQWWQSQSGAMLASPQQPASSRGRAVVPTQVRRRGLFRRR